MEGFGTRVDRASREKPAYLLRLFPKLTNIHAPNPKPSWNDSGPHIKAFDFYVLKGGVLPFGALRSRVYSFGALNVNYCSWFWSYREL